MENDRKLEIEHVQEISRFVDTHMRAGPYEDNEGVAVEALGDLMILTESDNLSPRLFIGLVQIIARTGKEIPAGLFIVKQVLLNRDGAFSKDYVKILIDVLARTGSKKGYEKEIDAAYEIYPDLDPEIDAAKERERLKALMDSFPGNRQ